MGGQACGDREAETIVVTGGGTGGHIYPALAVAVALVRRRPQLRLVYMGTPDGLEAELVPQAGLVFVPVPAAGFRGKGPLDRIRFLWRLLRGTGKAWREMGRWHPGLVLGTGGFVTLPVLLAARLRSVPIVLQEQNAIPGSTNRLLARWARRIHLGFPAAAAYFPSDRSVVTGNPVRDGILALHGRESVERGDGRFHLLVCGGSRGARTLNRAVAAAAAIWGVDGSLAVRAQTGPAAAAAVAEECRTAGAQNVEVVPYIHDMPSAYAWADLVVCRAGALTLAELAAAGLPAVLVPFPHAVDDHQRRNAKIVAAAGAAVVIDDADCNGRRLAAVIADLRADPTQLAAMAAASAALHRGDAAAAIAGDLLTLLQQERPDAEPGE